MNPLDLKVFLTSTQIQVKIVLPQNGFIDSQAMFLLLEFRSIADVN